LSSPFLDDIPVHQAFKTGPELHTRNIWFHGSKNWVVIGSEEAMTCKRNISADVVNDDFLDAHVKEVDHSSVAYFDNNFQYSVFFFTFQSLVDTLCFLNHIPDFVIAGDDLEA
jgi:hypothetical protein